METKKNAHRLNRIFRKPRVMVALRSWREEGDERDLHAGVSLQLLNAMLQELTDDDRARAVAQEDPPSLVQEELARRAERFGLAVGGENNKSNNGVEAQVIAVDEATLNSRAARFRTPEQQAAEEAMQRRVARFGAAPELKLSEADREAMARRESRFAA